MPHDPRVYAVITHDFADSPKMQVVSVEARWALLEMILYSRLTCAWSLLPTMTKNRPL